MLTQNIRNESVSCLLKNSENSNPVILHGEKQTKHYKASKIVCNENREREKTTKINEHNRDKTKNSASCDDKDAKR